MLEDMRREFETVLKVKDDKVKALETHVTALKCDLQRLEDLSEENDNNELRDTLIFSGKLLPAHSNMENCAVIISKLA